MLLIFNYNYRNNILGIFVLLARSYCLNRTYDVSKINLKIQFILHIGRTNMYFVTFILMIT
jgi:hypothetical protein